MSSINIVKYYFQATQVPRTDARIRQLVGLAYQTARDKQLYPKQSLSGMLPCVNPGTRTKFWSEFRAILTDGQQERASFNDNH